MIVFMATAACLGLGLVHLLHLVVPPRTDLLAGVGRWDQERARAARQRDAGKMPASSLLDKVAAKLADQVARRSRDLTALNQDLDLTGTTLERHLSRVLGLAAVALVGPVVILGVLRTVGLAVPTSFGLVLGLGLAASMLVMAQRELRSNANKLRTEFRRSLWIYLDLVAMSLEAGRGHAEALPAAANIGTGWTFVHLQDAIDGARFSGVTAWESLGALGRRIGLTELTDLDASLRLANDDGAKVKATLIARAGTLRSARIADAEAEANQATESMKFTLILMVFAFLAYEIYPSIVRLFVG